MIELKLDDFEFKEDGHVYLLKGRNIPSVSRIMQPVSESEYGTINRSVLERAAYKGTLVHEAIENYNTFGVDDIDDAYRGYFEAYKNWAEKWNPDIQASELRVYHKVMLYAGTVDMLAYIDGKLNLVDFKTSYKVIDKNYRLQLEAYKQALLSQGIKVEEKRVLHLKNNGVCEEVRYQLNDAEAWRVFGACKSVYDYIIN